MQMMLHPFQSAIYVSLLDGVSLLCVWKELELLTQVLTTLKTMLSTNKSWVTEQFISVFN